MRLLGLTLAMVLMAMAAFAQGGAPPARFSGSLTCKVAGRNWTGSVAGAIYDSTKDYLSVVFDAADNSEIQLTLMGVRREMAAYIPYRDFYEMDYGAMTQDSIGFIVFYSPNKLGQKKYQMMKSQLSLDRLNFNQSTAAFAFIATMATMKEYPDRSRPIAENLEYMEITDAESSDIHFIRL